MTNSDIGHRFLRSIAERDWPSLAACFANDAVFHAVIGTSTPFREKIGPSDIANQIKAWFEDGDVHQLLDSSVDVLANRIHVRYRIRNRENGTWYVVEQHVFLWPGSEGITRCDLLCSGFMPTDPGPAPQG